MFGVEVIALCSYFAVLIIMNLSNAHYTLSGDDCVLIVRAILSIYTCLCVSAVRVLECHCIRVCVYGKGGNSEECIYKFVSNTVRLKWIFEM